MRHGDAEKEPSIWSAGFQDILGALRNVPKAYAILWETSPRYVAGLAAVAILGSAIPVLQAWVGKLIVDSVVDSLRRGGPAEEGLRSALPYLLLEFGLIFVGVALSQWKNLVELLVNDHLAHVVNLRIIRKALGLEAKYFEDSDFYNKMQEARRQSEYRATSVVKTCFLIGQNVLTLLSFLAVLLTFNPWLALMLFCAAVPTFVIQNQYSRLLFRLQTWRTPETRRMAYLEQLLTQDNAVKEVRVFGLGEPLLERYSGIFWKIFSEDSALARSRTAKSLFWGMLSIAGYYVAYAWILFLTVGARITLGDMTLYLAVFRNSQGVFQGLLDNINSLYENALFLQNLFDFLSLESRVVVLDGALRPADDPARGLEFQDVWFRYPGRDDWALREISLEIKPGERLALVGPNGAGKTTLIKLLIRLYEPDKGRILYKGVDLKYFSPADIHAKFGVLFQDFVRYHMTLRENIGFGAVERLSEEPRILAAAAKSGADSVADSLPKKYDTRLGRWFEQGAELSVGQWQKVALGRAFMSEGEVLVLDEPTASLDASAEYEVFCRFRELSEGKTVVLVSHRFSTVRMADRIAVISGGKIEELGSHGELVKSGGTYARLFELQAQAYR